MPDDTNYQLSGNVATYTYGGCDNTIDIVIGDGGYFRYFKIVYPKAESNIQERPVIATDFTDWEAVSSNSGDVSVEKTTTFSNEAVTFTFNGVTVSPQGQNVEKFGDLTGYAMA